MSILVVDYDEGTLRTFKKVLQKRGLEVESAMDGEEAKQKIKAKSYDAVLVSFRLPDMDGIDLLLFMRTSLPRAAKILVSGLDSLNYGIRAVEAGADAFFAKPVSPSRLVMIIEEKLKQQKGSESLSQKEERLQ